MCCWGAASREITIRPGPELRGQGLMESSKLSPAEKMPVTSVPRFMTGSALQWWEWWEVGADQTPAVIQSAVRSSLGLEVPKPSSHIMKKSNPNHQDLQPDTSRRCKGSGEKSTDQGWDRGGVGGLQEEGSSCMDRSSLSPPPQGARLSRRASMSNCFKIKISSKSLHRLAEFGTGKNMTFLTLQTRSRSGRRGDSRAPLLAL